MLRTEQPVLSHHAGLYDLIPEDHLLRKINAVVDFGFVCGLVRESYTECYGRPAVHPEIVMRLIFLQFLYGLSDEQVVQEAQVNLAYKWFLGINPEDRPPDSSVLSRFRTLRLARSEHTIDAILDSIVSQCVQKGLVNSKRVVVDATHVLADTKPRLPKEVLRSAANKIMRAMSKHYPKVASELPAMPNVHDLEPNQAAEALLNHLDGLVKQCEEKVVLKKGPVGDALKRARKILNSEHRGMTKGPCSVEDTDARFGHKTTTHTFFGYKQHISMLDGDEIIVACKVTPGNVADGQKLPELVEQSKRNVAEVNELLGDAAYCSTENLKMMESQRVTGYVPVSDMLRARVHSGFEYNKDSDQWICPAGHASYIKRRYKRSPAGSAPITGYIYQWQSKHCKQCPLKLECRSRGGNCKGRELTIPEPKDEQKAALARERDAANAQIRVRRSTIEHKCAELKRFCGLLRARYRSLLLVKLQAVLASFVANAKRMTRLVAIAAA